MPSGGQGIGTPATQPTIGLHVSLPLQPSPSSHAALLGVCVHDSMASSHASTVQPTPSLQFGGRPALHPATGSHCSAPLQNNPSLHAALLGVCVHDLLASSHASTVHAT